jgi:hypothetical protein
VTDVSSSRRPRPIYELEISREACPKRAVRKIRARPSYGRKLMNATDTATTVTLRKGTEVEVLTRYERHWTTGFEIAAVHDDRFQLRRHSDGAVLPASFSARELRPRR